MTMTEQNATWFLAQLKPNSHHIAERNLRRQNFTTFLPMHERTRTRRDKFRSVLEPLFPGYIFVAFDTAKGGWRSVNATYGVSRLVSAGTRPLAVPRELVTQLRQRCDSSGKLCTPPDLVPGEQVQFVSGPFAEFVTRVESIDADKRIWVLLDLMGRATRVAVDPARLRRA